MIRIVSNRCGVEAFSGTKLLRWIIWITKSNLAISFICLHALSPNLRGIGKVLVGNYTRISLPGLWQCYQCFGLIVCLVRENGRNKQTNLRGIFVSKLHKLCPFANFAVSFLNLFCYTCWANWWQLLPPTANSTHRGFARDQQTV